MKYNAEYKITFRIHDLLENTSFRVPVNPDFWINPTGGVVSDNTLSSIGASNAYIASLVEYITTDTLIEIIELFVEVENPKYAFSVKSIKKELRKNIPDKRVLRKHDDMRIKEPHSMSQVLIRRYLDFYTDGEGTWNPPKWTTNKLWCLEDLANVLEKYMTE